MLSFCDCCVFSFFVFRLIIICEECPSTIRFTRTEIRRLNDRRGDSTACTLLLKTIMDILPPLLKNKIKITDINIFKCFVSHSWRLCDTVKGLLHWQIYSFFNTLSSSIAHLSWHFIVIALLYFYMKILCL